MATVSGTSASETLAGTGAADSICAGAGNDTVIGGGGNDTIDGGSGNDSITTAEGDDHLEGGAGDDTILAGGGANVVSGGAGNDSIVAGDGDDVIGGGAGNDQILAGGGANSLDGGAGNDTIVSGSGADTIIGGAGNDLIDSGGGADLVWTGSGDDVVLYSRLAGSTSFASFDGEAGKDKLRLFVAQSEYDNNATLRAELSAYQAFLASGQAQKSTFTFTFGDGTARLTLKAFETFEVVFTANVAPTAVADSGSAGENEVKLFDVLANDTDADMGDTKVLTGLGPVAVSSSNPAIAALDAAGAFAIDSNQVKFIPGALFDALAVGETATVTVTYSMHDAAGATSSAVLTLTVIGANDAPQVTGPVIAAIIEDEQAATIDLLATGHDVDAGADLDVTGLTYAVTSGTWATPVAYALDAEAGTLVIDAAQFQGLGDGDVLELTLTYDVSDGLGGTVAASTIVTVTGTGDAPVIAAGDDDGAVTEDGTLTATGTLTASDVDLDDTATWAAGAATYGSAAIDPDTGEWTYTLNNDLTTVQDLGDGDTLSDSFIVTVTDSDGLTDTRTVNIVIAGTADGNPTAFADTLITNSASGTTLTVQNAWLLRNDTDPTNDPLTVASAANGNGVDQVSAGPASTSLRVNLAAGGAGDFSYLAVDAGGLLSMTAIVGVTRSPSDSVIVGTAGNDILIDGRTDGLTTTLNGGAGSDVLVGGAGVNILVADQADLLIDGGGGNDSLQVTTSFDDLADAQMVNVEAVSLGVGATVDLAQQTEGFTITGASGNETITSGSGNDTITGGAGADVLASGAGNDVFVFNAVAGVSGDSQRIALAGNGNDRGEDTITGFDLANDTIKIVATGVLSFAHGTDTAIGTGPTSGTDDGRPQSFISSTGLVSLTRDGNLDFADPGDIAITFVSPSATLTQSGFEARLQYKLTGTSAINNFVGGALADVLNGGGSSDSIEGGAGNDTIIGGTGLDRVKGNAGVDQFRLQVAADNDIIEDFSTADKVGLRSSDMTFANTTGSSAGTTLNAADLVFRTTFASTTIADSNKVIVLTTAQGPATVANLVNAYVLVFNAAADRVQLWFDTNWNDTAGRTAVAVFDTLADLSDISQFTNTDFIVWTEVVDPIILDLDGNGFTFAPLGDGRAFDIDGDGAVDQLAWNTSGDGLLALDLNGNGSIDDGTELFTPSFGGGGHGSGAEALASLDGNGDGRIDAADQAFAQLVLWRDTNADGRSDAGEIVSLASQGITALETSTDAADEVMDGQEVLGKGSFIRSDGSSGTYIEIALETRFGAPEELVV
jgi:VCBS repeat-containing protein